MNRITLIVRNDTYERRTYFKSHESAANYMVDLMCKHADPDMSPLERQEEAQSIMKELRWTGYAYGKVFSPIHNILDATLICQQTVQCRLELSRVSK